MKLFIDTAIIEEIIEINSWGVISGVTTNPSLVAKNGNKVTDIYKKIPLLLMALFLVKLIAMIMKI